MALDPHEILQGSSSFEDIAAPPPLAGTRRQRLQRLQIGLIGLGAVFLLLGLANIIISNVADNQAIVAEDLPPVIPGDVPPPPSDPLADAGVVPELPVGEGEGAQGTGATGSGNGAAQPQGN